jgi:hypothetical protein
LKHRVNLSLLIVFVGPLLLVAACGSAANTANMAGVSTLPAKMQSAPLRVREAY